MQTGPVSTTVLASYSPDISISSSYLRDLSFNQPACSNKSQATTFFFLCVGLVSEENPLKTLVQTVSNLSAEGVRARSSYFNF